MMNYAKPSYSQFGEDRFLSTIFRQVQDGVYVDVGCHHPYRHSNTCLLHEQGWSGINIDANEASIKAFEKARPQDTNVWCAISDEVGSIEFHKFKEAALNTVSNEQVSLMKGKYGQPKTQVVPTKTLKQIAVDNRAVYPHVDYMNIDVEGYDLQALLTNDFSLWNPSVITIEQPGVNVEQLLESTVYEVLKAQNYRLQARMLLTSVYVKNNLPLPLQKLAG